MIRVSIRHLFCHFLLIIISTTAFAKELVLDAENINQLPKQFRTSSYPLPANAKVSTQGLSNLHIAGSAQFSAAELKEALKRLKRPVIIVDLRQENHGFVDGNAVSWFDRYDWSNINKTDQEIEKNEPKLLKELAQKKYIIVEKVLEKKEGMIEKISTISLTVNNFAQEKELAKENKIEYHRFYVTDHSPATPQQINDFIMLVRKNPEATMYFHCRAGKGRTTTFMVMYDIMHNAKKISFNDIYRRQVLLSKDEQLEHLPATNQFDYDLELKRFNLLKKFYEYARTNSDNFKTSWTEWLKKNP